MYLRQMLLTMELILISGMSFALVVFFFTKNAAEQQEAASLLERVESSAAALSYVGLNAHTLAQANGHAPPGFTLLRQTEAGMRPFKDAPLPADPDLLAQSEAVIRAAGGETASEMHRKPYETMEEDWKSRTMLWIGDLIGANWGREREVVAAAPVLDLKSGTIVAVAAAHAIYPPHSVSWPWFGVMALVGLLVSVVPATLVGGDYARGLSREIKKVIDGIDQVRSGRYEYRAPVSRADVIGQLQGGFNLMAQYLEDARTDHEAAMSEMIGAKKEAEIAAGAKSDFLANMSHEIRTPMNGIIGTASLMRETEIDEHQDELLNIIQASGQSLLHIINDVLDYSKLESAKMVLDEAPMDVRQLVHDLGEMFAYKASEKNVELIHYVDPSVPAQIVGDFQRVKQVVVNLVGNAIKFTNEGEIIVQATLIPSPPSGEHPDQTQWIQYSVRDSGIGIEPSQLDRIFEAFQQADVSTTREYGGSGLGLAISRKLCRLMGGDLKVESGVGEGSTFYFQIPFRFVPNQLPNNIQTFTDIVQGHRAALICMNDSLRELMSLHLRRWGMEAHAFSLFDASVFQELAALRPDAVVFDTSLQDPAAGLNLIRTLAAHDVPTLVLARLGDDHIPRPSIPRTNRLRLMSKPIKEPEFLKNLAAVFDDSTPRDGSNSHEGVPTQAQATNFSDRFPGRILIVEDQPMNQKIVSMMLQKLGYPVDIAENGQVGVDKVKAAGNYDIVFMDLQMPVLGGVDAARAIRGDFTLPRQPVIIAMTGHALTGVRESCMEAGMDNFMTKPVSIDDLREAIEHTYERLHAA